jgi:hypothetical protein
MAASFGLSPEIDWLYGHDPLSGKCADAASSAPVRP